MTGRIRLLPRAVVDVIAAGEVVERPASVVKELVENALDAGARRVDVAVEDGGRTLIRVEDDGEGMDASELPLAFSSHATSKIRGLEDLAAVATFGFRGEALASIGAVSDAAIASRTRGDSSGHRVEDRRGEVGTVAPAAHPEGTTVEVRSLFAGLPARRKFLRSPPAETARVAEVVARFALGRPDVAFTLQADGKVVLRAPAGESARERAARALGRDRAEGLLEIRGGGGKVRVEGFLSPPAEAEPGRPPQFLLVNGRSVADRTIAHAVRSALEGLVTVNRQPAWAIAVSLPPAEVDVNVHPAKSEVRFRRPSEVHEAVRGAVREAVLSGERTPGIPGEALGGRQGVREALDAYLGGACASGTRGQEGLRFGGLEGTSIDRTSESASLLEERRRMPILQVRNTFLVYEAEDGIAIVDQHALHERVLLERLHGRAGRESVEVQRLLVPEVIDCGPADAAAAAEAADLLRGAGLLVEPFGPGSIAVQGIPHALSGRPIRGVALAALRRVREAGGSGDPQEVLHGVLETMACHAAVRAGDPLLPEAAAALLASGRDLPASGHCAHGRPTELRISFAELEKRFRRRE